MRLPKLFYSVVYTNPSQLWARIRLLTKRKRNEIFAESLNKQFRKNVIHYTLNESLPKPIFDARNGFFEPVESSPKQFRLTFLNHTRTFTIPVNWHDEALAKGTRLWKLNLHYMEYLEEVDNKWFAILINDWIKQNSPYKQGYYLDSWNSYALSIRVVAWMQQLSVRREELNAHFVDKSCHSVYKQLQFLKHNLEKDIRGNHIIKNIKALLWGSRFFKKDGQVERWQQLGVALLKEELHEQVLPDGMHFERSPCYHNQVTADLLECYYVLPDCSLKRYLHKILRQMGNVTEMLKHPDGRPSLFNDGGLSMGYTPNTLTRQLKEQVDYRVRAREEIQLPTAGYFGFNKNGNYLLCDAGKIAPDYLPAHGHGDIFSFEWTIDEHRVFIDKGVYEYNSGARRAASRSTLSHNTVNIAHKDQCQFWGAFRVAKRAEVTILKESFRAEGFTLKATHNGYARLRGAPLHTRRFSFHANKFEIKDIIKGGREQTAEARFLLHPDVTIIKLHSKLQLTMGSVKLDLISSGKTKVIDSVWYPDFGVEKACKQIVVDLGTVPCEAIHKITRIK